MARTSRRMAFIGGLAAKVNAGERPSRILIEALRACRWGRCQMQAFHTLIEQPTDHGPVEMRTEAFTFVIGMYKQRPDVPVSALPTENPTMAPSFSMTQPRPVVSIEAT